VVVVAVLFLPGVVVYLILRPTHTLEEEYQSTLEEEALLQSIEDASLCPGCGRRVKESWLVCPNCHTRLKKSCHHCGKPMDLPWNLCPFCGTPAPGMRRESQTLDDALRSLPTVPVAEEEIEPDGEPLVEIVEESLAGEEEEAAP
jgi:RNA polymerase subunit RPABC4/transcription elongation factor Spt4